VTVLDVGCGTGNLTIVLAKKFPNSTFIGQDYSGPAIDIANGNKAEDGLSNITFVQGDGHDLPAEWTGHFDVVFVIDVLTNMAKPPKALGQIYRVIKDDGCLCIVGFGFHSDPRENVGDIFAAMFYTASVFFSLISTLKDDPEGGYGLMWGKDKIEAVLLSSKFKIVEKEIVRTMGTRGLFYCTK